MNIKIILKMLRINIHDIAAMITIVPIVTSVVSNFFVTPELNTLIMYVNDNILSSIQLINL